MRALLLHRDRDFDPGQTLPVPEATLIQDLELETVLGAMAAGDPLVFEVSRKVLLLGYQNDCETILYRQAILRDSLQRPALVRELYELAAAGLGAKKRTFFGYPSRYPSSTLYESGEVLRALVSVLRRLHRFAIEHRTVFQSEGLSRLVAMLASELSDEYLARIELHLQALRFPGGVLMSACLGDGNQGTNYVLRQPLPTDASWLDRLLGKGPPAYSFRIPDRDEAGATALSELRDRGIQLVANALAQSADHILSFFDMLRTELAFYVGGAALQARLTSIGVSSSFPEPSAVGARVQRALGLSDVCLALRMGQSVVPNAMDADRRNLVFITGANSGGKSSFLRAIGVAQLMMQAGLFVAAESFAAEVCTGLFTHYKREEDPSMKSGKFDEELGRMSDIAKLVSRGGVVLFNESFASTNEREGSEIARQIVRALVDKGIKVFFVTHLYALAHAVFDEKREDTLFLRAERRADGTRTFRLTEGEPLQTSYGPDLYREVFLLDVPRGES